MEQKVVAAVFHESARPVSNCKWNAAQDWETPLIERVCRVRSFPQARQLTLENPLHGEPNGPPVFFVCLYFVVFFLGGGDRLRRLKRNSQSETFQNRNQRYGLTFVSLFFYLSKKKAESLRETLSSVRQQH